MTAPGLPDAIREARAADAAAERMGEAPKVVPMRKGEKE